VHSLFCSHTLDATRFHFCRGRGLDCMPQPWLAHALCRFFPFLTALVESGGNRPFLHFLPEAPDFAMKVTPFFPLLSPAAPHLRLFMVLEKNPFPLHTAACFSFSLHRCTMGSIGAPLRAIPAGSLLRRSFINESLASAPNDDVAPARSTTPHGYPLPRL